LLKRQQQHQLLQHLLKLQVLSGPSSVVAITTANLVTKQLRSVIAMAADMHVLLVTKQFLFRFQQQLQARLSTTQQPSVLEFLDRTLRFTM
jgi:hypothetical protein